MIDNERLSSRLNTLVRELGGMMFVNPALVNEITKLEDQLSGTAQRAKDFEIKAAELQQDRDAAQTALAELESDRDDWKRRYQDTRTGYNQQKELAERLSEENGRLKDQVVKWQHNAIQNADQRDAAVKQIEMLTGSNRVITVGPYLSDYERAKLGGSSGGAQGCGGNGLVKTSAECAAPNLQDMARQVLLESLNNGKWIEYPELREFVISKYNKG